jgi:monoamine oxidase
MFPQGFRSSVFIYPMLAWSMAQPSLAASHYAPQYADVAIVGGGFSGLVSARELVKANKSVVVLEARDRVGGRVFDTHFSDGSTAPLGGQFVGPLQYNMVALAREYNVTLQPSYANGSNILYVNGSHSKFSSGAQTTGTLPIDGISLAELAYIETLLDTLGNQLDPAAIWKHPQAYEWDSQTFGSWLDNHVSSATTRLVMDLATTTGFCEEPGLVSFLSVLVSIGTSRPAKGTGSFNEIVSSVDGAEAMWCKGGCQQIAIKIADELGPERVKLSAPVRLIEETAYGYKITTDSGSVMSRKVVLALPPPMQSRIRFVPPLPAGRDQFSQRSPMGSVAKVIARYDTPFWRAHNLTGQAYSNQGTAFSTFDISPEDGSSGVLLGFVTADQSRAINGLSKAEIQALVEKDFINYFGSEAKTATEWIVQQWDEEEYTRGGYNSLFGLGALTRYHEYVSMPFMGIHFSGVETAEFNRGYIDGAISSGERAAKEVLSVL